eukprot:g6382.t1
MAASPVMTSTFKYVFVPADASRPVEEKSFTGVSELQNDTFIEQLKQNHFSSGQVNRDENPNGQSGKLDTSKLTDDVMAQISAMTSVDIFPLLLPVEKTGWTGVNVYVDDKGIAKNLPKNVRATELATECGYATQVFYGDAFLSRMEDSEKLDIWRRMDFGLGDMTSSAAWVKQAQDQVKNKAQSQSTLTNGFPVGQINGEEKILSGTVYYPATGEEDEMRVVLYQWSDKKDDVEVSFPNLPPPASSGSSNTPSTSTATKWDKKQVRVVFKKQGVIVSYGGKELVNVGKLFAAVEHDECSWSIVDGGKLLQLTLPKLDAKLQWTALEKGAELS